MFKQKRRFFTSALCLLLILLLFISCTGNDRSPASTTAVPSASAPTEYFVLDSSACAVFSTDPENTEEIQAAMHLLTDAYMTYFGRPVKFSDDWYRGQMVRADVEILIGKTNRPESIEAEQGLSYLDYVYEVVSPGVVVICGGSDEATRNAMERFLKDCYGYEHEKSNGECKSIPVGTSLVYKHSYAIKSLQLCESPIESYTIVHSSEKGAAEAARQLGYEIARACGVLLPTLLNTEYKGGNAIFLGMATPDGAHADRDYGTLSYAASSQKSNNGTQLFLDSTVSVDKIASAFAANFFRYASAETLQLDFEDELLSVNHQSTDNQLSLYTESEKETVGSGVIYRKLLFRDRNGKYAEAFVLEADLSKVSILNATPNNQELTSDVKATTKEAMQALAAAGHSVLAGVNADFFAMSSNYAPRGLCIKDGKELHGASNRPWFGISEDGTPVIGTAKEYTEIYKGRLTQAVGGSNVILKNGAYFDVGKTAQNNYPESSSTRHPRTAVGFTDDGKLILLVIDGRRSTSMGASLTDLADVMLALGATDALNLDGGGSSTMITYQNGDYVTRNEPSDGKLRQVYNSLVIVEK